MNFYFTILEKKKEEGGEDKKGIFLLKITTLAFQRFFSRDWSSEILVKATHLNFFAHGVPVCQLCCGNCHCICAVGL